MRVNSPIDQNSNSVTSDNAAILTCYNMLLSTDKKSRTNELGFTDKLDCQWQNIGINTIGIIELPNGFIKFGVDRTWSFVNRYIKQVTGTYTREVLIDADTVLKFNINNPITGEFTYNSKKELIIVFIEGCNETSNKPRYLNCDTVLTTPPLDRTLALFPDIANPVIYGTVFNTGGALLSGTYQIVAKYINVDNTESNYSHVSEVIPVTKTFGTTTPIGALDAIVTSARIQFTLSWLDVRFNKIQIFIIYNNGITYDYYKTGIFNYSNQTYNYSLATLYRLTNSSYNDIFDLNVAINRANASCKMDNRLLLGNLDIIGLGTVLPITHPNLSIESSGTNSLTNSTVGSLCQAIANNAIVRYIGYRYAGHVGDDDGVAEIVSDSVYTNPNYCAHNKTFRPGEVVALYMTLRLKTGGILGSFHIPGRPSIPTDFETSRYPQWDGNGEIYPKYIMTSTTLPLLTIGTDGVEFGYMGYWENANEVYDGNFPATQLYSNSVSVGQSVSEITPLKGQPVRHHRLPMLSQAGTPTVYQLSIKNIDFDSYPELKDLIDSIEFHYAKRNTSNSLVIAQGLHSNISWHTPRFHSFDTLFEKSNLKNVNLISEDNVYPALIGLKYCPDKLSVDPDWEYNDSWWNDCKGILNRAKPHYAVNERCRITNGRGRYLGFTKIPNPNNDNGINNLKFLECNDPNNNAYQESHHRLYIDDEDTTSSRIVTLYTGLRDCYYPYTNQELVLGDSYSQLYSKETPYDCRQGDSVIGTFYFTIRYNHNTSTVDDGYEFEDEVNQLANEGNTGSGASADKRVFLVKLASYSSHNPYFRGTSTGATETFYPVCSMRNFYESGNLHDNFINTVTKAGYNKQYSKLNDVEASIVYNSNNSYAPKLPFRIASSLVNASESTKFNWRKFDTTYYDMPYANGEIISLKATSDTLYIQQLYELLVAKTVATLQGDSATGNISTSTAQLFANKPQTIIHDSLGGIGCRHKFGSKLTKFGYIVIDIDKKTIFVIRDQIVSLNDTGLRSWFDINFNNYNDNPFLNNGMFIIDDSYQNGRFVIIDNSLTGFSLSYDFNSLKPISFHDYKPTFVIHSKTQPLVLNSLSQSVFEMNTGIYGYYFDQLTRYSAWFDLRLNPQPLVEKLLESLNWNSVVTNSNGVLKYDETFTKLLVYNDTQCTGYLDINNSKDWFDSTSGKLANGNWFFNNFIDIVKDDKLPLGLNLKTLDVNIDNLDATSDFFKKSEIIGCYIIIRMIYDNVNNSKFEISNIDTSFRPLTR